MTASRALLPVLLAMLLAGTMILTAGAQNDMSFTAEEVERGESLFDRIDAAQEDGTGGEAVGFDEGAVAEHDALACAAGLGCEGLAVSQDDALVLTGHDSTEAARKTYQKQYGTQDSQAEEQVQGEDREAMSFSEDEVVKEGESLFDRVDAMQENGTGGEAVGFDEGAVAEHDALACAAGLGCEGLAVSQDEALVLTGHDSAEGARKTYLEQYGTEDSQAEDPIQGEDLSVDADEGDMSFSEEEVGEDHDAMSFSEDEVADDANGQAEMSFTEEEAQDGDGRPPLENRFSEAEIAAFSKEEDALWSCAAGFGCKGAAAGLTPHQAVHRLGLPEYSYEWPLAACATNTPGACAEIGISLMDAMRIMSHLANPNR
ncbi:hypothetical protein [Nitratireductor basaltis]|uniref:Uncharacterized protein n=1 Tax=Nitratireductor basaltis TaxID=472175 RepID=A0A084U7Q4_9HYPH|nr:hypothetical protein [Nitratireductor basaltis]KFB08990.1 hypothetical protein EL18_00004 [Nitratireductor basaltis]